MSTPYDGIFFDRIERAAADSAEVLVPYLCEMLEPRSVLDVGSGTGAWAAAFAARGIDDYLCVDGDYVDQRALRVPPQHFASHDLVCPLDLRRRFDLAVCLEVGEHLPPECAPVLVASLVRHADAVLFSAAVPQQGGRHHLNEQWPTYWAKLFRLHGYRCFDAIRWRIWSAARVSFWYKQNTLLYLSPAAAEVLSLKPVVLHAEVGDPPGVVHPEAFLAISAKLRNVRSLEEVPCLPWAMRAVAKSAATSVCTRIARAFKPHRPH